MNWKRVLSVVVGLAMLVVGGCVAFGGAKATGSADLHGVNSALKVANFGILDLIGGLAAMAAAATLIGWGFGLPTPPKVTIACVLCAVGAWVLKAILTTFLWWFVGLSLVALVLGAAALGYTHIGWFEKVFKKDLNKNGTIGI